MFVVRFVRWLLSRFTEAWRDLDQETEGGAEARNPWLVFYIFGVVVSSLILQDYLGGEETFLAILRFIDESELLLNHPSLAALAGLSDPEHTTLLRHTATSGYYALAVLCYWAAWRVLGFLIIPLVAVACHPTLRKRPLGLSTRGMMQHIWIYVVLFVLVMIPVVIVSFFEEFQDYYPFYKNAGRSLAEFVIWETFYIAQFFSLEFFFRGFMIQPLRREMGSSVIFAMTIPYVMIHIGKPVSECFGAIFAGVILGTLAIRTCSIWCGFLIHVSVALSMDLLSLWQTGRFGE